MRKVEKPWGYEEIWAETDRYLGKILTILPGHRLSLQYHEVKEETVYVLEGQLLVWPSEEENNKLILNEGSVYHVKPRQIHRFGAPNNKKTKIIEVSTSEIDDVIRLRDDYKR
jgi:mannose-6-phosphate isomerase-like protein (cupin superfamily)|tara:strand:- start:621 stop:959 length:339 start_codon:yes stop_codon:yes gene_type:complete